MSQTAVLFVRVPPVEPHKAAIYEKWYDETHIPNRMDKPDFLGAQRYDLIDGHQRYFVLYEMASTSAMTTPEYLALLAWEAAQPADSFEGPGTSRPGFERGLYEQLSGPHWATVSALQAPVAYIVGHDPEDQIAFGAWCDKEYALAAKRVSGVLAIRRFMLGKSLGPQSGMRTEKPTSLLVHYLASERAARDPAFLRMQEELRARAHTSKTEPYVRMGRLAFMAQGGQKPAIGVEDERSDHDQRTAARVPSNNLS